MLLDSLTRQLAQLDATELADLLARRPDVTAGSAPVDLTELAERLVHPYSLVLAAHGMPLPALQVLEAALALGDRCQIADLAAFLDGGAEHPAVLDQIIAELARNAVVVRTGKCLELPESLRELIPNPLGLGEPMARLLADRTADQVGRIASGLGVPRQKKRADAVRAVVDHVADATRVQALVADVPDEVRAALLKVDDDDWSERGWRARKAAYDWAEPRGLVVHGGYGWSLPSEVARALRGPGFTAAFAPVPPPIPVRTPQPATVERESSVAAASFAAGLLALLDHLSRSPVATLKSGGLGARELGRLGKALGTDEATLRLALELADDCDLIDANGTTVSVTAQFRAWRDATPEEQFVAVLEAWWSLGITPTEARDVDDKPQRVLARRGLYCDGCVLARQGMVAVLNGLGATDRASLLQRLRWWHPGAHASPDDAPLSDQWGEAELLGVIADGAVSELGRALLPDLDGGEGHATTRLVEVARGLLPATAQHATFGSDLTAFVTGTPAGRVTSVLDAAADREGRGGAVTWRFSAGSVRRAFDEGVTAEALVADLAAVSLTELPQPLRYLIADVARRHGHLRLAPASAVVCSDDPALLALVAADRKLAKYGVRLLAPTVLAADVEVGVLLGALRTAGYFPVLDAATVEPGPAEHPTPSAVAELRAAIRAWDTDTETVLPDGPPDLHELSARLLSARPAKAPALGMTERVLGRLNRTLSTTELRQLAHAIDTAGAVGIVYAAASGGVTERVIRDIELMGTSLSAWCELRSDDREFLVSRITSVFPVQ